MSVQEVQAAIEATFQGNQEAISFLMAFGETDAAWGVSLEILRTSPGPACQFYAANMLYTKVSRHWDTLAPAARQELGTALFGLFDAMAMGETTADSTVRKRFCLLLATLCARSTGDDSINFSTLIKQLLACASAAATAAGQGTNVFSALMLSLEMAAVLPGAVSLRDLSNQQRDTLDQVILAAQDQIFAFLQYVLLDSTPVWAIQQAALKVLQEWAARGTARITLGDAHTKLSRVYSALISALCVSDTALGEILQGNKDTAEQLLLTREAANTLKGFLEVSEYPRTSDRDEAAEALLNGLCASAKTYGTTMALSDDDTSHALVSLATSYVQHELDLVAKGSPAALQFVKLLLCMTRDPRLGISGLCLDPWLDVQAVPLADRHPSMGAELYAEILAVLLDQCSYFQASDIVPQVSLDVAGDAFSFILAAAEYARHRTPPDVDGISSLRESAKDVFITCYYQLRVAYFDRIVAMADVSAPWNRLECALFAVRCVCKEASDWVKRARRAEQRRNAAQNSSRPLTPRESADIDRTSDLLVGVLARLCGQSLDGAYHALEHPLVQKQAALVYVAYRLLLAPPASRATGDVEPGKDQTGLLLPALERIIEAFLVPAASHSAARSFGELCGSLAETLADIPPALDLVLLALPKAFEGIEGDLQAGKESLGFVVEAGARVFTAVKDKVVAARYVQSFIEPIVGEVINRTAKAARTSVDAEVVALHLSLLAQFVRFLDSLPDTPGGVAIRNTLSLMWPHLRAASAAFPEHEDTITALCNLYSKMLLVLKASAAEHVEALLQDLVGLFEAHGYSATFRTLSAAMEVFGKHQGTHSVFSSILHRFSQHLTNPNAVGNPDLIRNYFHAMQQTVLFCPAALFETDQNTVEVSLNILVMSISTGQLEREATRAALQYLRTMLQHSRKAHTARILSAVVPMGVAIVVACLTAISGKAPEMLHHSFIEAMYDLLVRFIEDDVKAELPPQRGAQGWLAEGLHAPEITSVLSSGKELELLHALLLRVVEVPSKKQQFKQIMKDLARLFASGHNREDWMTDYLRDNNLPT